MKIICMMLIIMTMSACTTPWVDTIPPARQITADELPVEHYNQNLNRNRVAIHCERCSAK